ncbi:MAG TPA: MFS transporter [Gaiellaceae bacterium]|nr:MFS transporter [Gaiellaceae bacterium]
MSSESTAVVQEESGGDQLVAILLAMAMFVLVVDTSLMNVSISAVVHDLDTTASGVQSAIALEALVSAAFILIGSKIGDLFGRKRAYILGLLGYAVGALSMTLSQSLLPIIIFWAVIGGLGASLLLPAMQSLIHGNFQGPMQRRAYALVGAAAAIAAAVGPLIGGLITTYLSWRVAFAGEVLIIAIVLLGSRRVHDVPYAGSREIDVVGAILSAVGMAGVVLGILVWEEGGAAVGALIAVGVVALVSLGWWLRKRKREGKSALLDPGLFTSRYFRLGISSQTLQQIALGGLMIALPIFLQMVLEYNALEAGLSLAPLSLSMFAVALLAGKRAGRRSPSRIIRAGFLLLAAGVAVLIPIVPRAHSGWWMAVPLLIAGCGLGLLVSQLNNYTLSPIEEERVSEAAGVNSAGGSFGLSFGLAFAGAIMLASLSLLFTHYSDNSKVLSPAEQQQVSKGLEKNAEVMTNTQLEKLLAGQPADVKAEILHINTVARPKALQIALLVPLLAALLGLLNGFRMTRLPDPEPSAAAEGVLGG